MKTSDLRLLEDIRRGDERAFAQLVRRFQDRVFSLSLRMLGNREEAEDLCQEVFVALHQKLQGFRGQSQLSTWIYRVTRNRCLNRIKYLSRRAHGQNSDLESVPEAKLVEASEGGVPQPDQRLEGLQLQATLERALATLGEEQRMMVLLRDVEGLSYEAIADIYERPVGTVKSRLHRARHILAKAVADTERDSATDLTQPHALAREDK